MSSVPTSLKQAIFIRPAKHLLTLLLRYVSRAVPDREQGEPVALLQAGGGQAADRRVQGHPPASLVQGVQGGDRRVLQGGPGRPGSHLQVPASELDEV
eukprot:4364416-Pyramimonas_sp.AAC.1